MSRPSSLPPALCMNRLPRPSRLQSCEDSVTFSTSWTPSMQQLTSSCTAPSLTRWGYVWCMVLSVSLSLSLSLSLSRFFVMLFFLSFTLSLFIDTCFFSSTRHFSVYLVFFFPSFLASLPFFFSLHFVIFRIHPYSCLFIYICIFTATLDQQTQTSIKGRVF